MVDGVTAETFLVPIILVLVFVPIITVAWALITIVKLVIQGLTRSD